MGDEVKLDEKKESFEMAYEMLKEASDESSPLENELNEVLIEEVLSHLKMLQLNLIKRINNNDQVEDIEEENKIFLALYNKLLELNNDDLKVKLKEIVKTNIESTIPDSYYKERFETFCSPILIDTVYDDLTIYSNKFKNVFSEYEDKFGIVALENKVEEIIKPIVEKKLKSGILGFLRRVGDAVGIYSLKKAVDNKVSNTNLSIKKNILNEKKDELYKESEILQEHAKKAIEQAKVLSLKNQLHMIGMEIFGLIKKNSNTNLINNSLKKFMSTLKKNRDLVSNSNELRKEVLGMIDVINNAIKIKGVKKIQLNEDEINDILKNNRKEFTPGRIIGQNKSQKDKSKEFKRSKAGIKGKGSN